jgi:hypothetical protein
MPGLLFMICFFEFGLAKIIVFEISSNCYLQLIDLTIPFFLHSNGFLIFEMAWKRFCLALIFGFWEQEAYLACSFLSEFAISMEEMFWCSLDINRGQLSPNFHRFQEEDLCLNKDILCFRVSALFQLRYFFHHYPNFVSKSMIILSIHHHLASQNWVN